MNRWIIRCKNCFLSSDANDFEEKLKAKFGNIYRDETRKTYLKKKVPNVAEERLILLKNKEGLKRVKTKLEDLVGRTESETFDVRQPSLRKYFAGGKGERLVKSVGKDHACAIYIQKNFGQSRCDVRTRVAEAIVESDVTSGDDNVENDDGEHDSDDDEEEAAVSDADPSAFVTKNGHKISWRPGNIETEKVSLRNLLIC